MRHNALGWIVAVCMNWAGACAVLCAATPSGARGQDLISPYLTEEHDPFGALDLRSFSRRAALNEQQRLSAADILESGRVNLIAAKRRLQRERWLSELEMAGTPQEKWDQAYRDRDRPVLKRYRERCEAIEREYLADLRSLASVSDAAWEAYLRDRRRMAFAVGEIWGGLPDIEAILASLELSAQERAAVQEPLAAFVEQSDAVVRDSLTLIRETRQASETGSGDLSDQQSEAYQSRRRALIGRLIDAVERGQKTISDVLTPQHAAELALQIDVHKAQGVIGIGSAASDEVVSDLLRISSLTAQQRSQMRAMVRATQGQIARNFKALVPMFEANAAGRPTENENRQEELYSQASSTWEPLLVKLREAMMAALTPAQRSAFEEGIEPPLPWSERRWGEDIERAR